MGIKYGTLICVTITRTSTVAIVTGRKDCVNHIWMSEAHLLSSPGSFGNFPIPATVRAPGSGTGTDSLLRTATLGSRGFRRACLKKALELKWKIQALRKDHLDQWLVSELGERVIRGDVAEKQSMLKLQSDISKNENKFRLVRLG